MNEEKLNQHIKNSLAKRLDFVELKKTSSCPDEAMLCKYLGKRLSKTEEDTIKKHISSCYWCIEQLDQAQRAGSISKGRERDKKFKEKIINNIWFISSLISFILSFIVPRFFLQFLILALIMGMKWVFSTGGAKTVVMIYDALRGRDVKDEFTKTKNRF